AHQWEDMPSLRHLHQTESCHAMRRHSLDRPAAENDLTARGPEETGQRLQRCSLAGAVSSKQHDEFALCNREGDIPQRLDAPVSDVDLSDLNHQTLRDKPG